MRRVFCVIVAVLSGAYAAGMSDRKPAGERTWKHVWYLGGVPGVRVDQADEQQILVVTPSKLIVRVKVPATTNELKVVTTYPPRQLLEIPRENVLAVSSKGFRHDMHATQAWAGIPGVWPKSTDQLIILEFRLEDGTAGEMLLRVDKRAAEEIAGELRKTLRERAGP